MFPIYLSLQGSEEANFFRESIHILLIYEQSIILKSLIILCQYKKLNETIAFLKTNITKPFFGLRSKITKSYFNLDMMIVDVQ